MIIKETIGIDVSKLTLDVTVHSTKAHLKCANSNSGFESIIKWTKKNTAFKAENSVYVFEHTGIYSHNLACYFESNDIPFLMTSGLDIKKSLGITRGKDDKVDSRVIARYAYRLRDELELTRMPTKEIDNLKRLLSLRSRLVKQNAGHKVFLKETSSALLQKDYDTLFAVTKKMIKTLEQQIKAINEKMDSIINSSSELNKIYSLITSIVGIGPQIALHTIVCTHAFTKFKTHRQFASYCGVAPFPNSSGTSLRGRNKVSDFANKKMKSLLDMGAKTAIQYNKELQVYYKRRVEKGKNKMSTINIIRNKLIARMYAVVARDSPYVDFMKYAG